MKAITYEEYGTSEVLNYIETKKPSMKPNEVSIRIKHSSLNKADYIVMTGLPKLTRLMETGFRRPKHSIIGCDFTGIIEDIGSEITDYAIGDHVIGDVSTNHFGAFAQYISVTTDCIAKLPDDIPLDEAATLPVAGITAIQAINSINIKEKDEVLITGASGCVGLFALQLAKAKGAIVTGVCSTNKTSMVKELGADKVIDYTKENVLLNSKRYDYIINIAMFSPVGEYLNILKPNGSHLLIGGDLKLFMKAMLYKPFIHKKKGQSIKLISAKVNSKDLRSLANYIKDGTIKVVIDKRFDLQDTNLAMDYFESGKACGKILINM